MRLIFIVAAFGVLAIMLFTFHWMFRLMHWPFASELKFAALGMGFIGLLLLGLDTYLKRRKQGEEPREEDQD